MTEYKRNPELRIDYSPWQDKASCNNSDVDPDVFFSKRAIFYKEAIKLCGVCAVRQQCLNHALKLPNDEDFGIWGGLNHAERLELRSKVKDDPESK